MALYQLSYAPELFGCAGSYTTSRGGRPIDLLGLAMLGVLAAARAELLQRDAIGIVPFVLLGVVVALLTVGARQRNEHAISFLGHLCACLSLGDYRRRARAHGEDRTHDLTLTKGVLYH